MRLNFLIDIMYTFDSNFYLLSRGQMLFHEPLPFITDFVNQLNKAIHTYNPGQKLSNIQRFWISFCIMGTIVTNSVCWLRFQRAGMGRYSIEALSWMFRKSKIPWNLLLQYSVQIILQKYDITEGNLAIDDTDNKRSKSAKKIFHAHKIKDKASGGYIMGQSIVFLVLITQKITIPVGFSFYMPDPVLSAWQKNDNKLKKNKVPKKKRPRKPARNPEYPTMAQIALSLLATFNKNHPDIRIRCIFADALYGTQKFMDQASSVFKGTQVISQIRSNQLIRFRGKKRKVKVYFKSFPGTIQTMSIRGDQPVKATIGSARLHVHAHGKKRFVIALKYDGEDEYRYIIASDLSWRTIDIVQAYTYRWLIEVFFEDWKGYEGWGKMAKQTGKEGSSRGLILSLLVDHCLFFHPLQLARIENKLPAYTVGSMTAQIKVEGLLTTFEGIITADNPIDRFKEFTRSLEDNVVQLNPSTKHMVARDFSDMAASPSLKYRNAA